MHKFIFIPNTTLIPKQNTGFYLFIGTMQLPKKSALMHNLLKGKKLKLYCQDCISSICWIINLD